MVGMERICPDFDECHNRSDEEYIEPDCCGCCHCVLLRFKVGCGNNCFVRRKYPQYLDDYQNFQLATSVDLDEVESELESEYEYDPINADNSDSAFVSLVLEKEEYRQKRMMFALLGEDERG